MISIPLSGISATIFAYASDRTTWILEIAALCGPNAMEGRSVRLDYNLLKEILAQIEEVSDGQELNEWAESDSPLSSGFPYKSFGELAYHFDILAEAGFVKGRAERQSFRGHSVIFSLNYYGLTLTGHQLLDSMRQQGIWNRVKSSAEALGIGGLKQIPGLAVALLMTDT